MQFLDDRLATQPLIFLPYTRPNPLDSGGVKIEMKAVNHTF